MPQAEIARLRIHARGGVDLAEARGYLEALENAYNSWIFLDETIHSWRRRRREPWFDEWNHWHSVEGARLTDEEISSVVLPGQRLILAGVRLQSPGHWDFLGVSNVLEQIRKYLTERHERQKDRRYREPAEERKLHLENDLLEVHVIEERLRVADEYGIPRAVLAPHLFRIEKPLRALGDFQERGLIGPAELPDEESSES